jgi:hypothetical protein
VGLRISDPFGVEFEHDFGEEGKRLNFPS